MQSARPPVNWVNKQCVAGGSGFRSQDFCSPARRLPGSMRLTKQLQEIILSLSTNSSKLLLHGGWRQGWNALGSRCRTSSGIACKALTMVLSAWHRRVHWVVPACEPPEQATCTACALLHAPCIRWGCCCSMCSCTGSGRVCAAMWLAGPPVSAVGLLPLLLPACHSTAVRETLGSCGIVPVLY